jgi:hypothetical protein
MMDDVVGLSGHDRHVESVEHDAGLQVGREGHPTIRRDQASRTTAR